MHRSLAPVLYPDPDPDPGPGPDLEPWNPGTQGVRAGLLEHGRMTPVRHIYLLASTSLRHHHILYIYIYTASNIPAGMNTT